MAIAPERYSSKFKFSHILGILVLFGLTVLSANAATVKNLNDRLEQAAVYYAQPESGLLIDVTHAGNRIIAVGARGSIIYSEDQGRTWSPAKVPVSSLLTAVYFPDEQNGWAVGHGGIVLHSKDGGKTWVKQFDGNSANRMTLEYLQNKYATLKKEYDAADEYEQEDIAYAIEDMEFAIEDATIDSDVGPSKPLLDVWFKDSQEGYVVGAYGFFFHTLDGGETWNFAADRLENFDRYHLNAISSLQGGALLIVGEAGQMFASYDEGTSWETLYGPYQGSFFGLQAVNEDDAVLAYGLRGNIFKSDDAGGSWRKIDLGLDATLTASSYSASGELIVVGFSGTILRSQDNGESFVSSNDGNFNAYNGVIVNSNRDVIVVGEMGIEKINE